MNAPLKKAPELPDGYTLLDDIHKMVPRTTTRPYIDSGDIELHLINDQIVVKLDEVIAVLTSRTRRKTRLRVMVGLKEAGITLETKPIKNDLFA
jgi:hypothetical protein